MVAFDSWILYHYLRFANSLVNRIPTCLKKKSFSETVFSFLKSSQFCTITSTLRWICLQTRLMYNFRFPVWKKIHDQHLIGEMSRLTIKGNIWYIHDFLEALGNNIRVLFLIFDYTDYLMLLLSVFDISIIICFL